MRRILVFGCSGAGKSTLTEKLGDRLGLPVTHLDRLYWRPGWTVAPEEEFFAAQAKVAAGDAWVIDGTYSSSMHLRLPRADTVVFLDLPRRTSLRRVLIRTVRERGQETQAAGCPSKIDFEFLVWIWNWRRTKRDRLLTRLAQEARHTRQFLLGSARDVDAFLRDQAESQRRT